MKPADQAYSDLCGTAAFQDFEDWAEDNNVKITLADHIELDNLMFICDTCGWWCDISDLGDSDDGRVCSQCEDD